MQNRFFMSIPLTASRLNTQEARREAALAELLTALVAAPGVAAGLNVETSADGSQATVSAGYAVLPDDAGALHVIRVPTPQILAVPEGEGVLRVWISGRAAVHTVAATGQGGNDEPVTELEVLERLAYAPGRLAAAQGDIVVPGLGISVAPPAGAVALAEIERGAGGSEVRRVAPLLRLRVPEAQGGQEVDLARLAAQVAPLLPGGGGTVDEAALALRVADLLPAPPTTAEVTRAVLAEIKLPEVKPAPLPSYPLRARRPLKSGETETSSLRFTLPSSVAAGYAPLFSGRGRLVGSQAALVRIQPEHETTVFPPQAWAKEDAAMRFGNSIGVIGPNAGFYVSTLVPKRESGGEQRKDSEGRFLWTGYLQRFNPGAPIPMSVIDSVELAEAAGSPLAAPEITTLSGSVMWGNRAQSFSAYDPAAAPTSGANIIAPMVAGYRLTAIAPAGAAYSLFTAVVEGVLTLLPITSGGVLEETP